MTIVRIIPESIKPNPNAGRTVSWMRGHRTAEFRFPEGGKIPADLLEKAVIMEWRDHDDPAQGVHLFGIIIDPDDYEKFIFIPGIEIKVDNGLQRIEHAPESAWLYEHEDPEIKCDHCGKLVPVSEIKSDSYWDSDDDVFIEQICPHCGVYDTFGEIKYQSIKEALAEKQP